MSKVPIPARVWCALFLMLLFGCSALHLLVCVPSLSIHIPTFLETVSGWFFVLIEGLFNKTAIVFVNPILMFLIFEFVGTRSALAAGLVMARLVA